MMSPGFVDWGCGGIASNPVEVVLQRVERAVPVAGQRGQDGPSGRVGQRREDLLGDGLDGRRSIVASLPNQAPRPSAVVSAAHTFSGGCAIGTVRSMRLGNPMKASSK
jgi:hypothetical protein